jgi:hypothetical protein
LGNNGGAVAVFASFESFILTTAFYVTVPLFIVPLVCLVAFHDRLMWERWYLDLIGIYIAARMFIKLVGLNLLVFDRESSSFALITQ